MLTHLFDDLRHGIRVLAAKPGFTLVAILTLALGIGANTLVFTLIDGVYFGGLPYRDAGRLVDLYATWGSGGPDNVSIPDYVDLHRDVPALADSGLYTDVSFNLVEGAAAPERLAGLRVTPSLFSTLGVAPVLGRAFADDEAVPGHEHVAVLTDALWRNRFGADPRILERSLRLDGEQYRVVGVLPPGFMFPRVETGLFVPFAFTPEQLSEDARGENFSSIVGRLAAGASAAQVEAQAAAVVQRNVEISTAGGGAYARWVKDIDLRFGTRPLREQLSGRNASELFVLQIAVALVLLIALANVANLLLTRLSARRAELATRTALGARRGDIARQLLTESALLAAIGAALGVAGAWFGVGIVASSGLLPAWANFSIDSRTLAFTLAVTAVATLAFGLAPAFMAAGSRPQATLHETTRLAGGSRGARRLRAGLVVVQITLAIALLSGASLLLRSFYNAAQQDPGFSSANVLTAHLTLPAAKYPDAAAQARGLHDMLEAARALPGVEGVGATTKLPFSGENAGIVFRIEGRRVEGSLPHAAWRSVDEGFFAAMRIPVVRGRAFNASDWDAPAKSIVVDTSFERRYFPDGGAVGRRITLGSEGTGDAWTIVGVVGAVKHWDLTQPAEKPTFYFNLGGHPADSVFLALRTTSAPASLVEALRAGIRAVDAEQPLFNISTLDQRIKNSLTGRRVPLQLLGLFAISALLLAAIGIYGVLAFSVEQRTSEIGLRMAIGADSARVRRGVLADGARLVGIGVGIGVFGALATGLLLRSRLFDVAPVDLPSLAAVAAVLVGTAFVACWLPARRAARLNPIVALRHE